MNRSLWHITFITLCTFIGFRGISAQVKCSGQIIAIGGSSFNLEPLNLEIDRYILSLLEGIENPRVGFLGHASDDNATEIGAFYKAYQRLGAVPSHFLLSDLTRAPGQTLQDFKDFLRGLDVVFVGGGKTRQMVAAWQSHGLDQELMRANSEGLILAGVSAGGMCWFTQGVTSSDGPLSVIRPLGFVQGTFVPHAECQDQRLPYFREALEDGRVAPGYALDDHTFIHMVGGNLRGAYKVHPDKMARYLWMNDGQIQEDNLEAQLLVSDQMIIREAANSEVQAIKRLIENHMSISEAVDLGFGRFFQENRANIQMMVAVRGSEIFGVAELVPTATERQVRLAIVVSDTEADIYQALLESARVRAALFGLTLIEG